ncbi:MAG TPA: hypothetical protein ENH82_10935 [bacterium]|nr:hypothetical protein [bacterium]
MKSWYALQCRFQQELKTKDALTARGYEVYLPLTLTDKRRITTYATFKNLTEPLFNGYLFIQMSEGLDDFRPITEVQGVTNVVKMSEREDGYLYPTVIPDEIIEALKAHEDGQGIHSCHKVDYEQGDEIRVVRGAFKDLPGEIYSNDKDMRVVVLIELFNAIKKVEIEHRDIEPV